MTVNQKVETAICHRGWYSQVVSAALSMNANPKNRGDLNRTRDYPTQTFAQNAVQAIRKKQLISNRVQSSRTILREAQIHANDQQGNLLVGFRAVW